MNLRFGIIVLSLFLVAACGSGPKKELGRQFMHHTAQSYEPASGSYRIIISKFDKLEEHKGGLYSHLLEMDGPYRDRNPTGRLDVGAFHIERTQFARNLIAQFNCAPIDQVSISIPFVNFSDHSDSEYYFRCP
ncbi:MAG: hypothetical protein AAF220_12415 [Pseudomonadota bacterium]